MEEIRQRLQEISERKQEIRTLLINDKEVDLDALENELRDLDVEKNQLERREKILAAAEKVERGETQVRSLGKVSDILDPKGETEDRKDIVDKEKRGQDLKEKRAVTVASSNILTPKHQSNNMKGTFNQVSSLVDLVTHVPLMGGESYSTAYEKGHGEADYTAEGAEAASVEVEFGYVDIGKSKITAYSEVTEEVMKLPAIDYDSRVIDGVRKSIRRKLSKEILIGDGGKDHLVGIFSNKATAISASKDMTISEITSTTLDDIIFSYGGNEDVESDSYLILNKNDVKAFATLRDSDNKKVYEVKTNGNTGTIDGVPYVINSACKAISDPSTASSSYAMAYGPLENYELAIFSDTEIKQSEDAKFKEGMIAHRGIGFFGGNVVAQDGFLRIKKGE